MEGLLEEALARLEPLGVERVYLFGSRARGTADLRSDLDLLLVWPTPLAPLDRIGRVLEALKDLPLPVDAIVLTPEELEERKELPILAGILKEAKLIYGCEAHSGVTETQRPSANPLAHLDLEVPLEKVREYLLSPLHPTGRHKARFFISLGFSRERPSEFVQALKSQARSAESVLSIPTPFGQKPVAEDRMAGPLGESRVRTVWVVQGVRARLVTAYPVKGVKEGEEA